MPGVHDKPLASLKHLLILHKIPLPLWNVILVVNPNIYEEIVKYTFWLCNLIYMDIGIRLSYKYIPPFVTSLPPTGQAVSVILLIYKLLRKQTASYLRFMDQNSVWLSQLTRRYKRKH